MLERRMSLTTHASDHDRAIIPNAKEQSPLLELLKSDAAHILENRLESLGISFDPMGRPSSTRS